MPRRKIQNLHKIDLRRKPPGARCSDAVKACNGSRVAKTPKPSTADLQEQVAALTREPKQAREQQTATSEVLQSREGFRGFLPSSETNLRIAPTADIVFVVIASAQKIVSEYSPNPELHT